MPLAVGHRQLQPPAARDAIAPGIAAALLATVAGLLEVAGLSGSGGPGLPEDQREAALQRGARMDESTPGSGLGLSIVVELTRAYGGRGSAAYHPEVLLSLLVYGYASGTFSSRKIELATYDSLAAPWPALSASCSASSSGGWNWRAS